MALTKKSITDMMSNLPSPVTQHLKRCKKLAEYVFEQAKLTDWYLTLNVNEKEMISAIAYHDLGKAYVHKDYVHLQHCKNNKERAEYRSHAEKGAEFVAKNSDKYQSSAKSFDRYLYDCCTSHHERYDGTGFPHAVIGEEIPLVARICALVDEFDNCLNLGAVGSIQVDEAIAAIKEKSGAALDPNLCSILLSNEEALKDFCEELFKSDKHARKSKYGVAMRYAPSYDENDELVGMDAQMLIRDPYFGLVHPSIFVPIAERSEYIVQLNKIVRSRALRQMELFLRHQVAFSGMRILESIKTVRKKSYVRELTRLLRAYGVPPELVTIALPEEFLLVADEDLIQLIQDLHNLGVKISIDNFGERCSSFTLFEVLPIDEIRLSTHLTEKVGRVKSAGDIVGGLTGIATSLGVKVACAGVTSREQRHALSQLGITRFQGPLFGEALTAFAVEKIFNIERDADD